MQKTNGTVNAYTDSVERVRDTIPLYCAMSASNFFALLCFADHPNVVKVAFNFLFFDRLWLASWMLSEGNSDSNAWIDWWHPLTGPFAACREVIKADSPP